MLERESWTAVSEEASEFEPSSELLGSVERIFSTLSLESRQLGKYDIVGGSRRIAPLIQIPVTVCASARARQQRLNVIGIRGIVRIGRECR